MKLWLIFSNKLLLTLTGHIKTIKNMAVSSSSPLFYACSLDGTLKQWDVFNNKMSRFFNGHLSGIF